MKKVILTMAILALLSVLAVAGSDRGFMGVTVVGVNHDSTGQHASGVYITAVRSGSGADAAGMAASDRIISLNGIDISTAADLNSALESSTPGEAVTLTFTRGDETHSADITLGEKPQNAMMHQTGGGHQFGKWIIQAAGSTPRMGVALQPLGDQLATYFQVSEGVLVTRVIEDSGAWQAGIQAGDVLVDVNGQSTENVHGIQSALQGLEPGDTVDVTVQRRGDINRFSVTLDEALEATDHDVRFNLAFGSEVHENGSDQDFWVDSRHSNHGAEAQGESPNVFFGEASSEDQLKHRIHQLNEELRHLESQLNTLDKD
jgi:predicted metalloprotease with PDZ domain